MSATCFLGIDGGGTKTEALLSDGSGRILARGVSGPSNPYFVEPSRAMAEIAGAASQVFDRARCGKPAWSAVCVPGLARRFSPADVAAALGIEPSRTHVAGDHLSTFYGALGGGSGAVVLAGTGSFALAIDPGGRSAAAGGWGSLLGDEGSGYAIGLQALKAAILASEERGPATRLERIIVEHFGLADMPALRARIYDHPDQRRAIAALAPLVLSAAQSGDGVARALITEAAGALAELGASVLRRLGMDARPADIALAGGLANMGALLWDPFTAALARSCPLVHVRPARFVPAVGAVLLAMADGDFVVDEPVLQRLGESYGRIVAGESEEESSQTC